MTEATSPLTGGCLCGSVRFRIAGPLGPVVYCHCSQCRRATGTAFAANANVARGDFAFLSGAEGLVEYESSPGKFRAFCGRCGSPAYSRSDADPAHVRIRLGTLDQDPGDRAVLHIWVSAKAPWYDIADALPQIAAVP